MHASMPHYLKSPRSTLHLMLLKSMFDDLASLFDDLASLVERKERKGHTVARAGIMNALVCGAKPLANTRLLKTTFIHLFTLYAMLCSTRHQVESKKKIFLCTSKIY